jgi:putative hydrolase of the HAD superfamily
VRQMRRPDDSHRQLLHVPRLRHEHGLLLIFDGFSRESTVSSTWAPRLAQVKRAIVFDGDDTLWQTEQLYDAARQLARRIVEQAGLDGTLWEPIERKRDVENVASFGHSAARFPASCVQAYEEAATEAGLRPDPQVSAAVAAAARTAFELRAPLMPDARETLSELRERGLKLILLTKGDRGIQQRRIEQSGLGPLFDWIEIVDAKTPEAIIAVLATVGVSPDEALSVGNSIRSDVLPSLAAGVQPVWIDAHVWEYEHADVSAWRDIIRADDLATLLNVLP